MALTYPFDPDETIPAARLAWALERYAEGSLTREQIEATHELKPGYGVEQHLRRFQIFRRPIDAVLTCEFEPRRARATARSSADVVEVRLILGAAPEHRIVMMGLAKRAALGVSIRRATEADGPALRDLERRCAVEADGVSVYYDRGDDYFAQQRLMPHHVSSVAEYQGRVVGVSSDAIHPVRIGGVTYSASYRFHLRIDPEARGLGIMPALNASQGDLLLFPPEAAPDTHWQPAIPHTYRAVGNEQIAAALGTAQTAADWLTNIERIVLRCRDLAGPARGRVASPEDAGRIARLLSSSHAAEELALDFDAAWVSERMSQSPRDYSWSHVMLTERAVLGVWDGGVRVARTDASGTQSSRTATALDWGFEPGAAAELEALIRSVCASLAAKGTDDLAVFSSPPSPGRDLLVGLAQRVERFRVGTGGIAPSRDAIDGIHVDPIYF